MAEDFDVTQLASSLAQAHAEQLFSAVQGTVRGVTSKVMARFHSTYSRYIERVLDRYGRGKSFFVRSEAIPLYDFFVPLDLATQSRVLRGPDAAELVEASPRSIVSGTGGSGKSMMMRHFLVSCVRSSLRTPLFVELRQVNGTTDSLKMVMLRVFGAFGLEADEEFLESALKTGQLFLLLDGFDEVERSARDRVMKEIQQLAQRYPDTWIVLSSRPDEKLKGWELFTEFAVAPLDIEQAVTLVSRLQVESSVKERFISDIRSSLFKTHQSFLSNPLLLSIMLLTYGDVAHIPRKLSTFYSQAYEALFLRHDALKNGFQRERRTNLDIQDYSRAFAAFSLFSYDEREFSFGTERALNLIASAREAAMLDFDDQAFLDDAVQAICLLLEDGLQLAFAHRSFQEYFVAKFVQGSPPEIKARLVTRLIPSVELDSVMELLWEMDPYIVEKSYLLPLLAEIRSTIGFNKTVGPTHLLRFLRMSYSSFHYNQKGRNQEASISGRSKDAKWQTAGYFAYRHYRDWDAMLARSVGSERSEAIVTAYLTEFGPVESVPTSALRVRGPFLKVLDRVGLLWGREHLAELMVIEDEIRAKHTSNRESLADLLSASIKSPARSKML